MRLDKKVYTYLRNTLKLAVGNLAHIYELRKALVPLWGRHRIWHGMHSARMAAAPNLNRTFPHVENTWEGLRGREQ